MILLNVVKAALRRRKPPPSLPTPGQSAVARVLNVGGGSKQIPIPNWYRGWEQLLLDVDPATGADLVLDARQLTALPGGQFDAVYCSHNLEHYYQHDVGKVLAGFLHVLKPAGFAEIHVPDMQRVMQYCVAHDSDIHGILYESAGGPITVHDVIYGWGRQIAASGVDYYAHKTGFTPHSLREVLLVAGFAEVWVRSPTKDFAVAALAFKQASSATQRAMLKSDFA